MIEIVSHPGPDRSVTLEGLKSFKVRSRRYRNRRIGEFLKELHLTEGRNTGFKKILDALKKNGSPLPEFETDDNHDYFITRLFIREGFNEYTKNKDSFLTEMGTKKGTKKQEEISERKELVFEAIRNNPDIKNEEIEILLGCSKKQVVASLKILKEERKISRENGNRKGRWVIHND